MFNSSTLARFQQLETPFYYYDLNLLGATLKACKDASALYNFHVHYAMKANFNPEVLKLIQAHGFGADCVSGNEVKAAIEYGFAHTDVVFAGVGKSDKEINEALDRDIFCFNVESVQELQIINDLAKAKNKIARVAIRINPNVDAHTHHFITTGLEENKFGINTWELPAVVEALAHCTQLVFQGIHFHIGSQITDLEVYKNLCIKVNELQQWFNNNGLPVKVLNVGGGLGVDYLNPDEHPICDFASYFKVFNDFLDVKPGQEVHFELGRALVAQSASLIARVLYVKNGIKKNFLILDAGMTELIRPMLYQAYHQIENLTQVEEAGSNKSEVGSHVTDESEADRNTQYAIRDTATDTQVAVLETQTHTQYALRGAIVKYDVVGPICESTDCFRTDVELQQSFRGDLIAVRTAGAYGEVMASGYNLRDRVTSVYSE